MYDIGKVYERLYDQPVRQSDALADLHQSGKWEIGKQYDIYFHEGVLTLYEIND